MKRWKLGRIIERVEDDNRIFLRNCTQLIIVGMTCPLCRYNGYMLYCFNVD